MLSVSKKVVITLLLASFASVACAQQDSLPEKYTKTVLFEAKWGSGPGELGLNKATDTGPVGPTSFTVDNNGYIYILDNADVNIRIAKYDNAGNFVDYIYIYKVNHNGEQERKGYRIKQLLSDERRKYYAYQIAVDEYENIYLLKPTAIIKYDRSGIKMDSCLVRQKGRLFNRGGQLFFTDGPNSLYSENVWALLDNKKNLKKSIISEMPEKWQFADLYLKEKGKRIYLYSNDILGNFYYLIFTPKERRTELSKYSKNGHKLAIITLRDRNETEAEYAAPLNYIPLIVADDGSIYYLFTTEVGLELRKWYDK